MKADCLDRSDEEDCRKVKNFFLILVPLNCTIALLYDFKVIFPSDYEKDLTPKHTENGERVDKPLPVYLSVDILSFDKIDTVDMMIG